MKNIYRFLLNTVGSYLPISNSKFFGVIGKKFRLYCAKNISDHIGKNVNIEKGAHIESDTIIGDNSGIGINCLITRSVKIGENVMMGPDCLLYTTNHKFNKEKMKYTGYDIPKTITIEDDVWIGARCIILAGVTIGKGSTIGAGSVVTRNVPSYSLAAGNPAEVKKSLI